MERRHWMLHTGALALAAGWAGHGRAQAGTVRVIVGFAPGGSVDALARMTADAVAA